MYAMYAVDALMYAIRDVRCGRPDVRDVRCGRPDMMYAHERYGRPIVSQ